MIKYINRKKLLEEIDKRAEKMIPSSDGNHYTSVEAMREFIANFDTVKVNPVIHVWFFTYGNILTRNSITCSYYIKRSLILA